MKKQKFQNLRKAMKVNGDVIKTLAAKLNLKRWTLESRLYGKFPWKLDEIKKVCKLYNLTFEYLFDE